MSVSSRVFCEGFTISFPGASWYLGDGPSAEARLASASLKRVQQLPPSASCPRGGGGGFPAGSAQGPWGPSGCLLGLAVSAGPGAGPAFAAEPPSFLRAGRFHHGPPPQHESWRMGFWAREIGGLRAARAQARQVPPPGSAGWAALGCPRRGPVLPSGFVLLAVTGCQRPGCRGPGPTLTAPAAAGGGCALWGVGTGFPAAWLWSLPGHGRCQAAAAALRPTPAPVTGSAAAPADHLRRGGGSTFLHLGLRGR